MASVSGHVSGAWATRGSCPLNLWVTRTEYNPWFTKVTQTCSPSGMDLKDVGPTVFYQGRNPS